MTIDAAETLLFLHIPKAAGTTLSRVAERHTPATRQYRLGGNAQAAIESFNRLPKAQRARYRLISGHFPFGVHRQIPGPHAYFTVLREPADRVASFYYFVREDPGHYLNMDMTPAQAASLNEFARTTSCPIVDNGQTRQLAGDWGHIPFGQCDRAMLETAKRNLESVAVVGLTDRFRATLLLLGQRFGWPHLGYRKANETQERPAAETLDGATRSALENLNVLDQELYAFAQDLFESRWAASGLDDTHFMTHHPPPTLARDLFWRLKSRTPAEWCRKLAERMQLIRNS